MIRRRSVDPAFWALANVGSRVRYTPPVARALTTAELPPATSLTIPTRHGAVRAVLVRPPTSPSSRPDEAPPVIVQQHGGGFLNRYPEQDRHLARYLAADLGAVVVLPDYSTAPKVRYPVAEEETYDVARWVQASGATHGWDGRRLLLSGISAGAKLAINVCQQTYRDGGARPVAVSLVVPGTDFTRTDRTSSIPRPAISPFVQRLVAWAYFPDVERRQEALASPRYDDHLAGAMPPTLIQTAEHDTLAPEGADLARVLEDAGVVTVHREHPGADHGFYTSGPVERVASMLDEITTFFRAQLDAHRRRS